MLPLLRWPCLLQDVLNRRLLFKTNRQQVSTKGNHHPSFSVSGIGQKKTVDSQTRRAENVKQKPGANIRKWIVRFYYFRHLYWLEARVLLTIIAWVAHRYKPYLHCLVNILRLPLFLHSDQPLWGWNNPVRAGVRQSGRLAIHAGGGGNTHWSTDCFDVQPTTTSGRPSSRGEHHFQLSIS